MLDRIAHFLGDVLRFDDFMPIASRRTMRGFVARVYLGIVFTILVLLVAAPGLVFAYLNKIHPSELYADLTFGWFFLIFVLIVVGIITGIIKAWRSPSS